MTIDSTTKVYLNGVEQVKIIKNGSVIWEKQQDNTDYFYIENTYAGQNTVKLTTTKAGNPSSSLYSDTVEYSKDKTNWTTITFDTSTPSTISMNQGEKVYFRSNVGKFNYYWNNSKYWITTFTTSNECGVGGDIKSILDYTNISGVALSAACFMKLFYGCTELTTATLTMPSNIASTYCYNAMFQNCTSLTVAPALPATALESYSYQDMFNGCTSLVTPPIMNLNNVGNSSCKDMFKGCTALTTTPSFTLNLVGVDSCNGMFKDCTALTTTQVTLSATTLKNSCYANMFLRCSSLTTTPALPATTLANNCYQSMFEGCTSLTTAPTLPATTMWRYSYTAMFSGCTSLTAAPTLPATTLYTTCYNEMFYNCTSLTTAPALPATTLAVNCYNCMFKGCTSLTAAPAILPATTLATSCYYGMFQYCTSLTTAPELPATTLAIQCYQSMFYMCSNLNKITIYADDISATNCLRGWVENVSPTGTFYNNGSATYPSGTSGIPTGWTEYKCKLSNVVLTNTTGTQYSVSANMEWASSLSWDMAEIQIFDQGGGQPAYLDFGQSEVVNGVLTPLTEMDFVDTQTPENYCEIALYDDQGNMVFFQSNIQYTIQ